MKTDCGAEGSQTWNPSCYRDSDILLRTEKVVVVSDWPNSGPDVAGDKEWGKRAKEVSKDYLKKNIFISVSPSNPVMCTLMRWSVRMDLSSAGRVQSVNLSVLTL